MSVARARGEQREMQQVIGGWRGAHWPPERVGIFERRAGQTASDGVGVLVHEKGSGRSEALRIGESGDEDYLHLGPSCWELN
uniref:Uncharacterized protein n=1 Tax=Arundo donax TaxID=35708 RepID=A0A0A9CD08_ARUDO